MRSQRPAGSPCTGSGAACGAGGWRRLAVHIGRFLDAGYRTFKVKIGFDSGSGLRLGMREVKALC